MGPSRRAVALAALLLPLAAAGAEATETVRLDVRQRGVDNRAIVVSFARAQVGRTIGLSALVPMHVVVGADPDRELRYGHEGPDGRTLLRIAGGFTLRSAVRRNQWHLERTYLVDGFFRVSEAGRSPQDGRVLALQPTEAPHGAVRTITDFAE
jgi:hypothetical protein